MPIAVALITDTSQIDSTLNEFIVDGTLTLTGTYPTNGDTLSLASLGIPSNSLPNKVEITETTPAPGPQSGYAFRFVPGTTQANGLMEVFNGTTQFTTQAYGTPAFGITGFALKFRAWFPAFI